MAPPGLIVSGSLVAATSSALSVGMRFRPPEVWALASRAIVPAKHARRAVSKAMRFIWFTPKEPNTRRGSGAAAEVAGMRGALKSRTHGCVRPQGVGGDYRQWAGHGK